MAAKKTTRSLCRAIVARQVFEIVHSRCAARALRLVCFQYFCQETRTDEKKESPPMGFALEAENPGDVGLFPRETSPEDIRGMAAAFEAYTAYKEFPYAIRRRRADDPEGERIRLSEARSDRAASTNSFSRSESTCPRMMRAM